MRRRPEVAEANEKNNEKDRPRSVAAKRPGEHTRRGFLGGVLAEAAAVARWRLYLHIAFAGPFVIGLYLMAALWLRQNLPSRLDLHWLARFGGFLSNSPDHPPARRFNAGQKLIFWGVVLSGLLMTASGLTLMFPFFFTDVQTLRCVLLGHALLALLVVAMILGHIYIGTIGMEGAFDAMWSVQVDRNWAKEHHSLWVGDKHERGEAPRPVQS